MDYVGEGRPVLCVPLGTGHQKSRVCLYDGPALSNEHRTKDDRLRFDRSTAMVAACHNRQRTGCSNPAVEEFLAFHNLRGLPHRSTRMFNAGELVRRRLATAPAEVRGGPIFMKWLTRLPKFHKLRKSGSVITELGT